MNKKTAWVVIVLFFAILIGLLIVSYTVSNLGPREVKIAANTYLEIRLNGRLEEYVSSTSLANVLEGRTISLFDTWMNLRKAAVDPRIKAVVLKFGLLDADWAKIEELRQAVLEFRKSGKPVISYFEESPEADKEYYLATASDRILMHPLGWLGVNGLSSYVLFFKTALSNLGIKAEFEHIAEYKTAYNQFTENGFTPAHKEMMESIYQDIFDHYCHQMAAARKKSPEEMRSLIDRGYFQGKEAVTAGLVDALAYEDQLLNHMNLKGVSRLQKISNEKYTPIAPASVGLDVGKKIAMIFASGTIISGEEQTLALGSETVARWLRAAVKDDSIKAIIVRVDSPGGSAVGSDIIYHELIEARKQKPVIISMSGLAGSGGYWLALGGQEIIAQPQTLTGSIGVIAGKFSFGQLLEKLGIKAEKIVIGRQADAFSVYREFSPQEKEILENQLTSIYREFLERAAAARNLTVEEVDRIGRGRVWTGKQAQELHLIDRLGGYAEAIEAAKKLAGIRPEEKVKMVIWPKKRSWLDIVLGREKGVVSINQTAQLVESLRTCLNYGSEARVWSLMPGCWLP
ncbi:MAG TPA: signal peptide peptidase SppA [Candidatus Saccharicenans sp.]|nr:signal peptide peptidase SppA [Candidatus Saccharicenans sp.]HQO75420.1 signal peptide peptidase SppA [Candidatus Saccharicenans sp.]HUM78807.1 signal peptide peptidase SppA [Candidatus Saccharicenans sp.]